jgi:hypothetical protein
MAETGLDKAELSSVYSKHLKEWSDGSSRRSEKTIGGYFRICQIVKEVICCVSPV